MSKRAVRGVVSVVILVGALSLLLFTTLSQGAQTYKMVDEVAADPAAWYGRGLQVHGFVTGQVMVKPSTLEYRFDIQNNGRTISATYTGVVPDTFKTGSEVVLKGRLEPHGFVVEPDGVMAKCPSKYEAAGPGGPSVGN